MDVDDIPYLLKRICDHRLLERNATCCEARTIHHQFVRNYQRRLMALRRSRVAAPGFAVSGPIAGSTIGLLAPGLVTAQPEARPLLWGATSIEKVTA